jgi:hypothetical protein
MREGERVREEDERLHKGQHSLSISLTITSRPAIVPSRQDHTAEICGILNESANMLR